MNSFERVWKRLEGKPVDRVPNHCIIMAFGAKYIGASYKSFVSDYKVLTEAALRCREDFDLDILSAISDPVRETEGFGAEIVYPEDGVPYAAVPFIKDISDISRLKISDPAMCRRMYDRILAVGRLSDLSGKECPVQGWVEGAFAEACDLHDLNQVMLDIIDEPDAMHELLEICTRQAIVFAGEQIKAGADIIGIGDAAASLISPGMYEEFAFPYQKRIVEAVHQAGAKAKLHICGNIGRILDQTKQTGADIIDCDWMVDFRHANEIFAPAQAACGNFDPVEILLHGTKETVRNAVSQCLDMSAANSILAAGCEVPRDTPFENLKEVASALAGNCLI